MKLKSNCPVCGKELRVKSETPFGESYLREYICGHSFVEPSTPAVSPSGLSESDFTSLSGTKQAYDFQKEGVEFIFKSDFNCLIADPMGLGKTIQALLAAKAAKLVDGTPRFKRILIIVKSATTYQWFAESKEWFDNQLWSAYLIKGTKTMILPGFSTYILSMDTLSRFMKTPKGLQPLKDLGFDLVIVDECHSFKDPESARTQALIAFLQDISQTEIQREITLTCNMCKAKASPETSGTDLAKTNTDGFSGTWTETATIKLNLRQREGNISYRHTSQCPRCKSRIAVYQDRILLDERERNGKGLIMLSGTPIKNRAEEYFVTLNLLRPDLFTNLAYFRRYWLEQDPNTGKWLRIKPYRLEQFREMTKSFIIRREKNAVLSLPPFRRTTNFVQIEDETVKCQYNKALNELQDTLDRKANLNYFDVQENLMTLRRITAMGKVPFAVEYVEEFLESTEGEKIAIGIHHESVRDSLYAILTSKGIKCLKLSGEDSAEKKNRIVQIFNSDPEARVLIVNMIAGGVGLNLQVCNNTLVLERQWSAADEEQFEGRFHRNGQTLPVLADYMIASDSIDQYFSALVELKRQVCGESLDGWDFTGDPNAIREVCEKAVANRMK